MRSSTFLGGSAAVAAVVVGALLAVGCSPAELAGVGQPDVPRGDVAEAMLGDDLDRDPSAQAWSLVGAGGDERTSWAFAVVRRDDPVLGPQVCDQFFEVANLPDGSGDGGGWGSCLVPTDLEGRVVRNHMDPAWPTVVTGLAAPEVAQVVLVLGDGTEHVVATVPSGVGLAGRAFAVDLGVVPDGDVAVRGLDDAGEVVCAADDPDRPCDPPTR